MAAADYRLLTEATGQRIAAGVEALSGTGAAAAAARANLDVYSKSETDNAIAQSTAIPFAYDGTPGTDPFNKGGSGVILNITAPNGTIIGHLVFRPKNYSTDTGKNRAIELYNAS